MKVFSTSFKKNKSGFTLIEVLVVVSIIGLLSSILVLSTNVARAKGRDAKKQAEMASVRTALNLFFNDKGKMPNMYNCLSTCTVATALNPRTTLEIEDTANPTNPTTESGKAFLATMNELVAAGFLPQVPKSPGGTGYIYYDYGQNTTQGVLFGTTLEGAAPSTTGLAGSCRPHIYSIGGFAYIPEDPTRGSRYCPDPVQNPSALPDGVWRQCLTGEATYTTLCNGGVTQYGSTSWYNVCPTGNTYTPPPPKNICDNRSTTDYCICNQY